jgi:hypothetical protein
MSRPVTQFSSMTIKYRRCWTGSKKANLNLTPTQLYWRNTKSNYTVTIEKLALPLFQCMGLKAAKTEPFSRSQKVDDCCQICWSPVSQEHPEREENYDDMPIVIRVNAPTIGIV